MNIHLIPNRGSGFIICNGKRAVTDNNPKGQFVVPLIDATDDAWSRRKAESSITAANGDTSKYYLSGDRLKMKKLAPLPVTPEGLGMKFHLKKKKRKKATSYAR